MATAIISEEIISPTAR